MLCKQLPRCLAVTVWCTGVCLGVCVSGMSGMGRSGGGGKGEEFIWNLKGARERVRAVGSSRSVRCGCIRSYPPPLALWQKDLKPQELSSGRS